jgi:hypothetical protein
MIEKIYLVFEVLALLVGLASLHNVKQKPGIFTVLYIVVDLVIASSIEIGWLPKACVSIIYLSVIILCMFEYGDNVYQACIYAILALVLVGILQMIILLTVCVILGTLQSSIWTYIISNFIVFIIMLLLNKYGRLSKYVEIVIQNSIIGRVLIIIATLLCIFSFGFFQKNNQILWTELLGIPLFIILFSAIVFEWQKEKWLKEEKEKELQAYSRYNLIYKDLISEVRRKQHDFNNHLQAIFSMNIMAENLDELVKEQNEYCSKILSNNSVNKLLREDIDSVLAGFLYSKIGQAEEKGITVKYRIHISNPEEYITFIDLVEIIGNLFDNSIEAVNNMENKIIDLLIEQDANVLTIEISNPYDWNLTEDIGDMVKEGKSSKGNGRGFGLANVNRVLDKYHGTMQIKAAAHEDRDFIIFRVHIPM